MIMGRTLHVFAIYAVVMSFYFHAWGWQQFKHKANVLVKDSSVGKTEMSVLKVYFRKPKAHNPFPPRSPQAPAPGPK